MEITVIAHPRGYADDHEMAGFRAMDMDDIARAYKGRPLYIIAGIETRRDISDTALDVPRATAEP